MRLLTALCLNVLLYAGAYAVPQKYVASITQEFEQEPVVIVLENTLGNVQWVRNNRGDYRGTLAGAFPQGRVIAFVGRPSAYNVGFYSLNRFSNDVIQLNTSSLWWNGEELLIEPVDSMLAETPITIEVYPQKIKGVTTTP